MMEEQRQNIKFVQEVEKYPCLYNYKLAEYSRKDIVESTWNKVGEKMNMSGISCKKKWKNLRAVFARHLKTYPTGGAATRAKKQYYLTNLMRFVLPYIKVHIANSEDLPPAQQEAYDNPQKSIELPIEKEEPELEALPEEDVGRANVMGENCIEDNTTCMHLKRKMHFSDDNNPRKMFLLSLLPEINEMTEPQMKLFKRKIFGLIDEITLQNLEEIPYSQISSVKSSPQSYSYHSD